MAGETTVRHEVMMRAWAGEQGRDDSAGLLARGYVASLRRGVRIGRAIHSSLSPELSPARMWPAGLWRSGEAEINRQRWQKGGVRASERQQRGGITGCRPGIDH
jgi:hypothetical protein